MIGQRICATCPEPDDYDSEVDSPLPKYKVRCAEPSATITYSSAQKNATLCGWQEVNKDGYIPSSPPEKYLRMTFQGAGTAENDEITLWCAEFGDYHTWIEAEWLLYGTEVWEYDPSDCTQAHASGAVELDYTYTSCASGSLISTTTTSAHPLGDQTNAGWYSAISRTPTSNVSVVGDVDTWGDTSNQTLTITLSNPDTEADALDRESISAGTAATSLYELRTDTYSFTHRTAAYTTELINLDVGVEYEGCIRLQRRESYAGTEPEDADTTWQDVEPDQIAAFTATAPTEAFDEVDLPIAQGYEYRIEGIYIYPTSAGCECPSEYTAP